ncbi:MAG: glycosyltransferase family 2 protein, partial [Candidatus Omnitrophota bacterium]|nr:glycosyltransferase family 2 protein [Candidatus Omnitrophota bacterium]
KLARLATFKSLGLRAGSFDIEIEIIAKALRDKLRIQEVPIHYSPRAYSQGKKIRLRDGIWAAASIFRYRMGL